METTACFHLQVTHSLSKHRNHSITGFGFNAWVLYFFLHAPIHLKQVLSCQFVFTDKNWNKFLHTNQPRCVSWDSCSQNYVAGFWINTAICREVNGKQSSIHHPYTSDCLMLMTGTFSVKYKLPHYDSFLNEVFPVEQLSAFLCCNTTRTTTQYKKEPWWTSYQNQLFGYLLPLSSSQYGLRYRFTFSILACNLSQAAAEDFCLKMDYKVLTNIFIIVVFQQDMLPPLLSSLPKTSHLTQLKTSQHVWIQEFIDIIQTILTTMLLWHG